MLNPGQIKKILVISLSNIGDIILTFPVIDILKRDFPQAQMDLIVGPKGGSLVVGNPQFSRVWVYHKNQSFAALLKWMRSLIAVQYDLVVDLRNTAIPFLIFAKHKTPLMLVRPAGLHMREQHLARLRRVHDFSLDPSKRSSLFISDADRKIVEEFLAYKEGRHKIVVFAPGSRAENKRWRQDGFAKLADYLVEKYSVNIVFVGDENDVAIVSKIKGLMKNKSLDLTGKLTLPQVGHLLSVSRLAIVNDSAPMHLASYLNVPVAAFFGPTDPKKYGPWSLKTCVIRKNIACLACRADQKAVKHNCIVAISFEDAVLVLEKFLPEIFDANQKR